MLPDVCKPGLCRPARAKSKVVFPEAGGPNSSVILCRVENKVGNCGQCSASIMDICIHFQLLKSNLDFWKFHTHSVKPPPHPVEESLGVIGIGGVDEAIKHKLPLLMLEAANIDLGEITVDVTEDAPADAIVGGESLESGPSEGLLVVYFALPVRTRPREDTASRRIPHLSFALDNDTQNPNRTRGERRRRITKKGREGGFKRAGILLSEAQQKEVVEQSINGARERETEEEGVEGSKFGNWEGR